MIRHGETALNSGANGGERLRGWLPIPLDPKGMVGAKDTAEILKRIPHENIDGIWTSDLVRAVQSAHVIADSLSTVLKPRKELRDWNIGSLAGKPVKSNLNIIHELMDHPLRKAPEGESYREFTDRTIPFLRSLIETSKLHIAVSHNRILTLTAAYAEHGGKRPDDKILKSEGPVDPSGFIIVHPDWQITFTTPKQG